MVVVNSASAHVWVQTNDSTKDDAKSNSDAFVPMVGKYERG